MPQRCTRLLVLAALVASAALLAAPAAGARPEVVRQASTAAATATGPSIVKQINAARRSHGLRALSVSAGLRRAAVSHARSMVQGGYFSHGSPSERIRRYYSGTTVGETMLWRSPSLNASEAVQLWLASSAHRRIMLAGAFREVGVGVVQAVAGGAFGGRLVTVVVADFGAR